MLPILTAFTVGIAPLLRGAWDLWAQLLVQFAVLSGFSIWLAYRIHKGSLPGLLSGQNIFPVITAGLAGLSTALSPVVSLAVPEWRNLLVGLWIIAISPLLSGKNRIWIERTLRFSAWIIFLLAFYQNFIEKSGIPAASLVTSNSFAAFMLMLLPLAFEWRDWALFGAMLWAMTWVNSWGAWLALAVTALVITGKKRKGLLFWSLAVTAAATAAYVAFYLPLSVNDRLVWWEAALRMIKDSPLSGFGTGTFAYVFPAYHAPVGGLSSLYAHNFPLQFIAENGLPCGIIFACWIILKAKGLKGAGKWAAMAALIHSMVDFGLSIPANFWIFCYLLGRNENGEPPEFPVAREWRIPAILMLAAVSFYAGNSMWREWKTGKLIIAAREAYEAGDKNSAFEKLEYAGKLDKSNSEARILKGKIYLEEALISRQKPGLLNAAVAFERALELNPFRPATYSDLSGIYLMAGEKSLSEDVLKRRSLIFK